MAGGMWGEGTWVGDGGGGVRTSLYPCTGWLEVLKGQWVGETGGGNKQAGRRHAEEGSVHQLLLVHA